MSYPPLLASGKSNGMKYKFQIMTNHVGDVEKIVDHFNVENGTDLKVLSVLDDEVTFVELEASMTYDQLFDFGFQFGFYDRQRTLEGRIA